MTDTERGFLEYLYKRREICEDNYYNNINKLMAEKDAERKELIRRTIHYYVGARDTYDDLIDAFKHTFSDK